MIDFDAIAEADREGIMKPIRTELYKLDKAEMDSLARRIGRTYDCLSRIRRGSTKWPGARTLLPLIYSFDMRLVLVPAKDAEVRPYRAAVALTASTQRMHLQ